MDTAFFLVSKTARFFIDPGNILLLLVFMSTILAWSKWRRASRLLITMTALFCVFFITVPVGSYAVQYLEQRFPANPSLPEHIDGIIVLGGALDPVKTKAYGQPSLGGSAERILMFAKLANQYPNARLIYSGGSGHVTDQINKEADFVLPILQDLGVEASRITLENQSRNTFENAKFSYKLMKPEPDDVWILITSASHMPRSIGSFRQINWINIIPYPVDFSYIINTEFGPPMNLQSGMGTVASALIEWIGLTAYYLTNKTNEFVPGPR
jgi:uncharacterized SAM-binding protein YcdF (DUF218 family)